jgi:hypothetical protein
MAIAMKPGFIHLQPFTTQATGLLLFLACCFLVLLCWPVAIVASLVAGLLQLLQFLVGRRMFRFLAGAKNK